MAERANDRQARARPFSNYGPYAPVYVAEELGYYKDNGVKARGHRLSRRRGAAQEALAAGGRRHDQFLPALAWRWR